METKQFQLDGSQSSKLTTWKNEPTILNLKQDLESAKPSHDAQMVKIREWNNLMKVEGSAKPPKIKGRSSVQPKLIRRQAEWRYSALSEPFLSSDKLFKVSPVTAEDEPAAKQNELVLNWQFRTKLNRIKLIDEYVRTTTDEGTSILRAGWKRVTVPVKQMVPIWTHYEIQSEEQAQALQAAIGLKEENLREFSSLDPALQEAVAYYEESGQPTVAEQTGEREVTVEKIIENRPTVDVLNPDNVYIDPSCNGDIEKALFVVVSFETNKAELLKEGKRYKNLDRVNWESNTPLNEPDHSTKTPQEFKFSDPLRKKVVAYEYWGFFDIHDNGTLVPFVATWIGDVMIRMEVNPFPDEKLPFVVVTYLPVKRELYGEPDAELLEDNQKILGAVSRGMIDLLGRSANGQLGFAKSMLDTVNRRRFEEGKDYEFNPTINPKNGLIEHTYPEIPQSALVMLNLQNQEAEALTGVKSFSGGISGESYGDVATGIRGVLDAAGKREMAILRRLANGITAIGNKIIAMNAVFMSEEETIRVTNKEFVTVKREDLAGNFDLMTDISTTEIDNLKAQDLGFLLQTLGPNASPEIVMMILAEIAELKRMPALAEKLRTWRPQPTPEQQKLQELEMMLKEKEIAKLDSEINLNNARAAEAGAKKDKTNLEFVEQETGTTHAREMEKQGAQGQANQNLIITKALVTPLKEGEKRPNIEAAVGFNQISDRLMEENTSTTSAIPSSGMAPI
jgi:hypothetical protein